MQQEIYDAIKVEWCKISRKEQRTLIYTYIQGDGSGLRGSWMEFLQKSFGLHCPVITNFNGTPFASHHDAA